jgi:hypothetical protein
MPVRQTNEEASPPNAAILLRSRRLLDKAFLQSPQLIKELDRFPSFGTAVQNQRKTHGQQQM